MKRALVLGVTGQDGSYLADFLLEQGYTVYGLVRRSATGNTRNIDHLLEDPEVLNRRFFVIRGDIADPTSIYRALAEAQPDEVYNEADQDHVRWSYDMVGYSSDVTGSAVARILEMIKQVNPKIKYFQPCTSNMYGLATSEKQNEQTPFNPQSPYACCKVFAYYITRYYREAFDMFASTAIFYNHESPRRTDEYVTRKITKSVARIATGKQDKLVLGDLSARIDWGYAREYMEAAHRILQHTKADDFVVATGEAHSVEEFVGEAFACVGLDPKKHVSSSQAHFRPTKTSTLIGDTGKLRREVGFEPRIKFKELVRLMVDADLAIERGAA